jgi:uncharacterized membrane-anchored protein YitT (DUF2179 family)
MKIHLFAIWRTIIPIAAGTAVYAFGLHYFVLPNQLMEGGLTGIGILFNYAFGWPLSVTTILLNIPLFIIGWRMLGFGQMIHTIVGTVLLSVFLAVMEALIGAGWLVPFHTRQDYILAALYAGVTLGCGLGVVFRFGGTTGGADILARIAVKKRGWSMGQIILTIDALVIGLSLLFIPIEKVLYTLITVFVAAKLIDVIQEGAYAAKSFSIITENGEKMADLITKEMDRGVTVLQAVGAYSGNPKQMVYCVVARQEIRTLKMLVRSADAHAFIVVSGVQDVLGEGFKDE